MSVVTGSRRSVLGALLCLPLGVMAQLDPTRPPFAMPRPGEPVSVTTPPMGGAPAAAASPAAPADAASRRRLAPRNGAAGRLSSVLVAPGGTGSAVIDGQVFQVGDKVPGGGVLWSVDRQGASVKQGATVKRLRLMSRHELPGVAAAAAAAEPAASAASKE
jgi:hypothetical protein